MPLLSQQHLITNSIYTLVCSDQIYNTTHDRTILYAVRNWHVAS